MYSRERRPSDLDAILLRARVPELNALARDAVAAMSEGWKSYGLAMGPEEPAPVPVTDLAAALQQATGMYVRDIILLPDDAALPRVKKMAQDRVLSPKRRLGEILHHRFGKAAAALSDDVRHGLREYLVRSLRLDDQETAFTKGFEYAVRMGRRDALYHFLSAAVVGDERGMRSLEGLVRCMRHAVPLAMVDERSGFWLAHRS